MASAGADRIHCDIMDGHFVKNISFGPSIVQAVARSTKLPIDIHLMVDCPQNYLSHLLLSFSPPFYHSVIFHIEASRCASTVLGCIRNQKYLTGLAINPDTSLCAVYPHLKYLDFLLIMTVHPGFGGQAFLPDVLKKIRSAAEIRSQKKLRFHIAVDGGICAKTAARCHLAGANLFIAGTAIFGASDRVEAIHSIRNAITNNR